MDLRTGLIVWFVVLGALILMQRAQATLGVGLVLAYFMNLALIHLPGAVLYLDPSYAFYKREWVELGFEASSFAILAFGVGALATLWLLHQTRRMPEAVSVGGGATPLVNPWLYRLYVAVGLLSFFVIQPLLRDVPTVSAVTSVFNQLLLLGICLGMWRAWQARSFVALMVWIAGLGMMPVMTIVLQGFIGFGTSALLTGLAFLASFFRPRWLVAVFGVVFVVVGISAFVTYFRDRDQIRRVVWGNESFEERTAQFLETFGEFELIDLSNPRHLNSIDLRLNQNVLIGAAIENLGSGKAEFKNGATLVDALIALVPRAIWPDKPVRAGSGNLVTDATGIEFDRATSVGVGQVLEFYFNFGMGAVIVGGLLWGVGLAVLDVTASRYLLDGDVRHFTLYYLIGLGLIQPGGSLVDIAATSAAAILAAFVVNDLLVPFFVGGLQEPDQVKSELRDVMAK